MNDEHKLDSCCFFIQCLFLFCLFRPLIRVVDKLLVIGLLGDKDLNRLLNLIDPENFNLNETAGLFTVELLRIFLCVLV